LRPGHARECRQRGGARGQIQEFAAREFHAAFQEQLFNRRLSPHRTYRESAGAIAG
jgi:hypothetical protein